MTAAPAHKPTTDPAAPAPGSTPAVLLLDDEPDYPQLVMVPALADHFEVTHVETATQALAAIQRRQHPFHLVILDLMLNERMPRELAASAELVSQALRPKGLSSQYSAQALGLWLWKERTSVRQPYCYLTSYPDAHAAGLGLDANDTEFGGVGVGEMKLLVCQRGTERNGGQLVDAVRKVWADRNWCGNASRP